MAKERIVKPNVNDNENVNDNNNDNNNDNTNDNNEFLDIWSLYGKVGNKTTAMAKYNRLTKKDKESIKQHIPLYIKNHVDNDVWGMAKERIVIKVSIYFFFL